MEIVGSDGGASEGGRAHDPMDDQEDDLLGLGLAYGLTGLVGGPANEAHGAFVREWAGSESSRYELLEELGRGGMGVVYRARDLGLLREVAVKVLPEGASLQRMERFRKERLIAARLDHPAILPVYDSGVMDGGGMFLAMKLIRGETLRQLMSKPDWAGTQLSSRLSILLRVAEAAAFAHDRGVIHRDIKPANIMVGALGEVLLLDWGLAADLRRSSNERLQEPSDVPSGATPGSTSGAGTPGYMAPEQRAGIATEQGPWTDVYALGCLLFEMMTGRQLTETERVAGQDLRGERFKQLVDVTLVPAELAELLCDSLVAEPLRRLPSASSFVGRIQDFLAGQEARAREVQAQLAEARGRVDEERRTRNKVISLGAAVLLGLLLASYLGYRNITDAASRKAQSERLVLRALDVAQEARSAALTAPSSDVSSRERAVEAFHQAQALAEDQGVDTEPRQLVRSGLALAEKDLAAAKRAAAEKERDDLMARRLLLAEEPKATRLDLEEQDRSYAAAFLDYGLDLAAMPRDHIRDVIRDSALRPILVRALTSWGATRYRLERESLEREAPTGLQIFEFALMLEPSEKARNFLSQCDTKEGLSAILAWSDADLVVLPASYLVMAADGVGLLMGAAKAAEFLDRIFAYHANDFFLCFQTAYWARRAGPSFESMQARGLYAALACRPGHPLVMTQLATYLALSGQKERAHGMLQRVLAEHPDFVLALYELGLHSMREQDWKQALVTYEKLLPLDPNFAEAWCNSGYCRRQLGDLDGAIVAYERSLRANPWLKEGLINLGNERMGKQEYDAAVPYLLQARAALPRQVNLDRALARALLMSERPHRALEMLNGLELAKETPAIQDLVEQVRKLSQSKGDNLLLELGADPNAVPNLASIGSASARLGAAEALHSAGRFRDAVETVRPLLSESPDWRNAHRAELARLLVVCVRGAAQDRALMEESFPLLLGLLREEIAALDLREAANSDHGPTLVTLPRRVEGITIAALLAWAQELDQRSAVENVVEDYRTRVRRITARSQR